MKARLEAIVMADLNILPQRDEAFKRQVDFIEAVSSGKPSPEDLAVVA